VSLQTTIYNLADRGWSQRRIANDVGINRETVRRYLRLAKAAISTPGSNPTGTRPVLQSKACSQPQGDALGFHFANLIDADRSANLRIELIAE
jgi:hypothetical protein